MFSSIVRDTLQDSGDQAHVPDTSIIRPPGDSSERHSTARRRRGEWQETQNHIMAMAEQMKYESPHSTVTK